MARPPDAEVRRSIPPLPAPAGGPLYFTGATQDGRPVAGSTWQTEGAAQRTVAHAS